MNYYTWRNQRIYELRLKGHTEEDLAYRFYVTAGTIRRIVNAEAVKAAVKKKKVKSC